VLDYGSGNLRSVEKALQRGGADTVVTADPETALQAGGLVVPGVGAFAACMTGLRAVRGDQVIDRRLAGSRPVLGICVGMQVLFAEGVEHGLRTGGCAQWPGTVERLTAPVLPHMGWNTLDVPAGSRLLAGLGPEVGQGGGQAPVGPERPRLHRADGHAEVRRDLRQRPPLQAGEPHDLPLVGGQLVNGAPHLVDRPRPVERRAVDHAVDLVVLPPDGRRPAGLAVLVDADPPGDGVQPR